MKPSEFIEKRALELEGKLKKDGRLDNDTMVIASNLQAIIEYLDSKWDVRRDSDYGGKDMG